MTTDYSAALMVNKLSDANAKHKDSNNYKLFELVANELSSISETEQAIRLIRNIDNAYGETLDLIGESINLLRGSWIDSVYKTMIKAKMARFMATGDYDKTYQLIAYSLGKTVDELKAEGFQMTEDWETTSSDSGWITIAGIPLATLNEIGLTTSQFTQIIKSVLPIGIGLTSLQYEGTFEFGGLPLETDNAKGFGSAIDSEIGGTLGDAFAD